MRGAMTRACDGAQLPFWPGLDADCNSHSRLIGEPAPDNKTGPVITYSALGFRVLAAIVVFYFANKCAAAKNRWPAVGMWLLGFVVGFPLGILVITGAVFAAWYALR